MKNLVALFFCVLGGFSMIAGIAQFAGREFLPGNPWVQAILGALSVALGAYLMRVFKERRPKKDIPA